MSPRTNIYHLFNEDRISKNQTGTDNNVLQTIKCKNKCYRNNEKHDWYNHLRFHDRKNLLHGVCVRYSCCWIFATLPEWCVWARAPLECATAADTAAAAWCCHWDPAGSDAGRGSWGLSDGRSEAVRQLTVQNNSDGREDRMRPLQTDDYWLIWL